MIETPAAKTATVLILGTIFSAAPFGISIQDIAVGTGFAVIGVVGRGMVDMQKSLEDGGAIKLGTTLGWMSSGIVGSPFVTTMYLAILKSIHYPVDAFTAMALLGLGYAGPKAITKLAGFAARLIPNRINPNPPPPNGG